MAEAQAQQTSQSSQGTGSQATAADSAAQAAASTQAQSSQAGTSQATASTRPDWVPEKFWDATTNQPKGADLRADYDRLLAFHGAEQSKILTRPQSPDAYKPDLPKDFKVPEGFGEFKFRPDDPALKNFAIVAHEAGLSQDQYSKALASYAATVVDGQQQLRTAMNGEITKLGVNGPARMDALRSFVTGAAGEKMAETIFGKTVDGKAGFGGMLWTAAQVEAMEWMVGKITNASGSTFSQSHRDVQTTPQKLSDEAYAKLTIGERKAYAAQFPQDQFTSH